MKRKCHATGPHHDDPCIRGMVCAPNRAYLEKCDHCHGTGEVEDHRKSTPITPEGLRGLGMVFVNSSGGYFTFPLCDPDGYITVHFDDGWHVNVCGGRRVTEETTLGTAPDLEWVESMIGLLRRANNGEG